MSTSSSKSSSKELEQGISPLSSLNSVVIFSVATIPSQKGILTDASPHTRPLLYCYVIRIEPDRIETLLGLWSPRLWMLQPLPQIFNLAFCFRRHLKPFFFLTVLSFHFSSIKTVPSCLFLKFAFPSEGNIPKQ